ncbi:MAG: hypothetical protein HQL62_09430 [Magnetococcales bacterium]|nr:hypothetical protein [Magnetococcales bacterium]
MNHIFDSVFEAIHMIVTRFLNQEACRECTEDVFLECRLRRAGLAPTLADVAYDRTHLPRVVQE